MAEAAGIAEGTIFRVFPDKTSLIHEAVRLTIDPEPIKAALAQIHPGASLEVQLAEAARILLDRFEVVITLMSVLRTLPHTDSQVHIPGPPPYVAVANQAINVSVAEIFERHRGILRLEPARAAAAFRGLILASGHPALSPTDRPTIDEVVSVLLSGVIEPSMEVVG